MRPLLIVFINGALTAPPDAPPLPGFLPPRLNFYAANTELAPPTPVASASACAASCLANPACISINVCAQANGSLECGLLGWSMAYDPAA